MMLTDHALGFLTGYLNEAEHLDGARRVRELLEQMLELEEIDHPVFNKSIGDNPLMVTRRGWGVVNPLFKKVEPDKYQVQRLIERQTEKINHELLKYRFQPRLFLQANRGWTMGWTVRGSQSPESSSRARDEGSALYMILEIAKSGSLGRLRRCLRCGKWLYATLRHQRFCSTQCQQMHYRHSDEWRAKRRDYMRGYRRRTM